MAPLIAYLATYESTSRTALGIKPWEDKVSGIRPSDPNQFIQHSMFIRCRNIILLRFGMCSLTLHSLIPYLTDRHYFYCTTYRQRDGLNYLRASRTTLGIDLRWLAWEPVLGADQGRIHLPIPYIHSSRIAGVGLTLADAFQPWTLLHIHFHRCPDVRPN
jgi:hypothetical protein